MFKSGEIVCKIPQDAEFISMFGSSDTIVQSQFDSKRNIFSLFADLRSSRSAAKRDSSNRDNEALRSSFRSANGGGNKNNNGKNDKGKGGGKKPKLLKALQDNPQARRLTLSAFAVIIIIAVICMTSVNSYKVYLNDEFVCAIPKTQITSDDIKNTVAAKIKEENGVNIELSDSITIKKGHFSKKDIVTNDFMLSELSKRANYTVEAAQAAVNGQVLAVVKDTQTANEVLNNIAQKYIPEGAKVVKTEFVPNVDITTLFVSKDQISEPSVLSDMLTKTTNTPKSYTVVSGDTLFAVANKADITLDELLSANPGVTESTPLQIGQTLNLVVAVPLVSVRITQEVTETQTVPYGTQTVENDSEYKTYSKVISAGVDGEKVVTTSIVSLNGIEESRSVVSENITKQAVDEKVEVGTLQVPPKRAMGSFNYPAAASFTSGFGSRWGTHHDGIDLAAAYGTPIYASDGGVVEYSGYNNGGYGYLVIIDHENGYETYYGHNSSLAVSQGQRVAQGELIAYMGSTGDSTGNHVHFEIRKNGVPENPLNYLNN